MSDKRDLTGFGAWLRERREERGWKQQTAVDKLHELTGIRVRREWLSQLENGDTPSEELVRALERLYGDFTPGREVTWTIRDQDVLGYAVMGLIQQVKDLLRRVEELEAHLGLPSTSLVEPLVPRVTEAGEYEVDLLEVANDAARRAHLDPGAGEGAARPAEGGPPEQRRTRASRGGP